MRRVLAALTTSCLLLGVLAPAAIGGPPTVRHLQRVDLGKVDTSLLQAMVSPSRQVTVMLQMAGSPAIAAPDGLGPVVNQPSLLAAQAALYPSLAAAGVKVLGRYQYAYNGIKVATTAGALAGLAAPPGVVAVHAVRTYAPDNTIALPYVGAPAAWSSPGATGAGQTIAIIDTGIDYTHADFGGKGTAAAFTANDSTRIEKGSFPTAKVIAGYDFAGNGYDADGKLGSTTPTPDPDPLDCYGHGTHVSGTAAGQGVLANHKTYKGPYDSTTLSTPSTFLVGPGVAPQAKLVALKVFGCDGTTNLVMDALEWVAQYNAAHAGAIGVVNMSLGSIFGSDDDPDAVATNNLVGTGVVVVASAGNSNAVPFVQGPPSSATQAIAVAALDAYPTLPLAVVNVAVGSPIPAMNQNAYPALPVAGTLHVLSDGAGGVKLGCEAADYDAATAGKIVAVKRGVCPFVDKGSLAQGAGAIGIIVINRDDTNAGDLPTFIGYSPELFTIPMIGTDKLAQPTLLSNEAKAITLAAAGTEPNPTYKQVADFSSSGPRFGDNALKPDVAAPGVNLFSAAVGTGFNGTTYSGTSMAAPMTAGTAALVRQAHPTWTALQVKAAISNTADASAAKIVGYDPLRAGSGVVQTNRAVATTGLATTSDGTASLSFGYEPLGGAYSETKTITLTNTGGVDATYALKASTKLVKITPASVKVKAHQAQTVQVTASLTLAQVAGLPSADQFLTGNLGGLDSMAGVITATPNTNSAGYLALRVPYLLVPRGLSNVTATLTSPLGPAGKTWTGSLDVVNGGVHDGVADIYALGLQDGQGDGTNGTDVRAIGVQTFDSGTPGDPAVQFAINTWDRFTTAAPHQYEIDVDTNGDKTIDYYVIGLDEGWFFGGEIWDGVIVDVVFDADFNLLDAWYSDAPINGSTVLLPIVASDIGLTAKKGTFTYTAIAWDGITGGMDATAGWATFNPFKPLQASGVGEILPAGTGDSIPVWADRDALEHHKVTGWMVVSLDDANGAPQAALLMP